MCELSNWNIFLEILSAHVLSCTCLVSKLPQLHVCEYHLYPINSFYPQSKKVLQPTWWRAAKTHLAKDSPLMIFSSCWKDTYNSKGSTLGVSECDLPCKLSMFVSFLTEGLNETTESLGDTRQGMIAAETMPSVRAMQYFVPQGRCSSIKVG